MKIYLIGMPGSGKSTLGRKLASALAIRFIDLDHEIEQNEGKVISQIFAELGEDEFRKIESNQLHAWASAQGQFVIATGGGAPCFLNGIDLINETGISIFLDVPVNELVRRLKENKDRPLLQSADLEERLTSLRNKRIDVYAQAHVVISDPSVSIEQLLEILRSVKK
jgi:shikimate kinase